MAIAIPSVTRYITQSRKKTLVDSIDSFILAVNDDEFGVLSNADNLYFIQVAGRDDNNEEVSCVSLEKGGEDPFGNWKTAYVAVHFVEDREKNVMRYDYYFTFYDDAGYGMVLTKSDAISTSGSDITNPTTVNSDNVGTNNNSNLTITQADGEATDPTPVIINPSTNCEVPSS